MKTTPFISASKLVEYCFASPARRTAIIESMILPPAYILDTGYADIERATAAFLSSGGVDDTRLKHLDAALLVRVPANDHEEQRLLNAHDAIEHALHTKWIYPESCRITPPDGDQKKFNLGGVTISVGPTVVLRASQTGRKTKAFGVGKAYFGKSWSLSNGSNVERGTLFAALLHWFAESTFGASGDTDPKVTFVGDVFARKVFSAPKNYAQRRKQLAASAQEIEDRWHQIRLRLEVKKLAKRDIS